MQVQLNAWNQPFYDALQRRDLPGFLRQLGVFFGIAGVLFAPREKAHSIRAIPVGDVPSRPGLTVNSMSTGWS